MINWVKIYDTTLRDGTQGEGVSFTVQSKLRVAEKLDQFGCDYIEGGWPGSNPRDMAFFQEVQSLSLSRAKIVAFGSTRRAGIDVEKDPQVQLLCQSEAPVVTLFGKTWLLHVKEVLRTTPKENLAMIEDTVAYIVTQGREVIYDAEHFFDGYLNNSQYAIATLEAAFRGGATNVSLCDTNGGKMVTQIAEITELVCNAFPKKSIGMHCHNDCGLGVAASLAGVQVGADLVQGTFNGYGERTGNANLTTIIANLSLKMGYRTQCEPSLSQLRNVSLFIDDMANLPHDSKAPFVGESAFVHKGGVHANAVAKIKCTYEHIEPEFVGNRTRVVISDMSGRSSLILKARDIGFNLNPDDPEIKNFLESLKQLEFRGYQYESADASFKLLLKKHLNLEKELFETVSYRVIVERDKQNNTVYSEATAKILIGSVLIHTVSESSGPVAALDEALRKALRNHYPCIDKVELVDFKVRILNNAHGSDAIICVHMDSRDEDETWGTVGAGNNIIVASWQAIRDSLEYKILKEEGQKA